MVSSHSTILLYRYAAMVYSDSTIVLFDYFTVPLMPILILSFGKKFRSISICHKMKFPISWPKFNIAFESFLH